MTHAYGRSALQARCGAREVYCSVYARDVTCAACQRLRDGVVPPPDGGIVVTLSYAEPVRPKPTKRRRRKP